MRGNVVKWDMSGADWVLTQSNNFVVNLRLEQHINHALDGTASYSGPEGEFIFGFEGIGTSFAEGGPAEAITGSVTDDGFRLEIDWGHTTGVYEARIDQEGNVVDGVCTDKSHPGVSASFTANRRAYPLPGPPDAPPADTGFSLEDHGITAEHEVLAILRTATVNSDVDVYDEPGGIGGITGVLRAGSTVTVLESRDDGWCNVKGAAVPPAGYGWVWGEFLTY